MRISELRVSRYGQPLSDSGKIVLRSFNVFFGENEDGKTLTIDAIIKMMFGANVRDFQKIDRVDENPEGYVIVKDNAGKEFKLPEKGNLTKLTGLTSSECRNIFVIRNSDLAIAYPENDFYLSVMDKLVGLRAKSLKEIKQSLRNIGKITPNDAFKNDRDEKLKTRIDNAETLVRSIDELFEEVKKEDLDKLEVENFSLADEINTTQMRLELFETARKRVICEKGETALAKLKENLSSYETLTEYTQKDEQAWRYANRDIETLDEEERNLKEELSSLKKSLFAAEKELEIGQINFTNLETKKQKIDEEIRPELKKYGEEKEKVIKQEGNSKLIGILAPLSTVIVICSLIGAIISQNFFFYALASGSVFLTAALWGLKFRCTSKAGQLHASFEGIKLKTSPYGLAGDSAAAIFYQIGDFEQSFKIENQKLRSMQTRTETLKVNVSGLEDTKIPELNRKRETLKTNVENLKTKFKVNSIDEYTRRLEQKTALEKSIAEQEKTLEALFGKQGQNKQESLANWEKAISEFSEFKNKAQDIQFDEKEVAETREKQTKAKETQLEINEKLTDYYNRLKEIEREANEILRLDESLYCCSCTDLIGTKKVLENFISWNYNNRSNVLDAMKIFEEIERVEKNKVSDLFGAESSVSKVFSQITEGRYIAVHLKPDSGIVQVETKNGDLLDAEKLSSGTYDQLYLSIRIALGEKLLKGDKAFFIMDDPLIKADKKRLQTQLSLLKQISDLGWQIVYFTAKDEVKDALRDHISTGSVNLIEMHK